ncbi:RNA-directed DNA polymerase from mobile element jockey, partial [Stegodyphus mimosarum]
MGNDKSECKRLNAGVAQGSILGPVLYLFYVSDFPKMTVGGNTFTGCYADDTALAATSFRAEHAITKLQTFIPAIEDWCTKWRIAINAQKSQLLIIRKKTPRTPLTATLSILAQTSRLSAKPLTLELSLTAN